MEVLIAKGLVSPDELFQAFNGGANNVLQKLRGPLVDPKPAAEALEHICAWLKGPNRPSGPLAN
ncbi:MAG: hypothetical protein ACHQAY_06775 [Hyphomicrobiales bacterium]